MIYLDNAATTFPKPITVHKAISGALTKFGANPGRSGHKMSVISGNEILSCREEIAELFNVKKPENVTFTLNCTYAINMVLKGLLKRGDHVVVSNLEHNAVMRPLKKMEDIEVTYTTAEVFIGDNERTLNSFRTAINERTKLIICMHASNVWGIRLPIERISALAKIYGIPILVDAAQTAGVLPIDVQRDNIDFLCIAGHKGLYGPMGTGILITNSAEKLDTIIEGGTGTNSMRLCHPDEMPQKFEIGTPNTIGISGLKAGVKFVKTRKPQNILEHELSLITRLYDKLKNMNGALLYTPRPNGNYFVPVLSFNLKGYGSTEVGEILDKNSIEVRPGLHCSPLAHEFFGTAEIGGTVRISPSVFNTKTEIDKLVCVLNKIPKR